MRTLGYGTLLICLLLTLSEQSSHFQSMLRHSLHLQRRTL